MPLFLICSSYIIKSPFFRGQGLPTLKTRMDTMYTPENLAQASYSTNVHTIPIPYTYNQAPNGQGTMTYWNPSYTSSIPLSTTVVRFLQEGPGNTHETESPH